MTASAVGGREETWEWKLSSSVMSVIFDILLIMGKSRVKGKMVALSMMSIQVWCLCLLLLKSNVGSQRSLIQKKHQHS